MHAFVTRSAKTKHGASSFQMKVRSVPAFSGTLPELRRWFVVGVLVLSKLITLSALPDSAKAVTEIRGHWSKLSSTAGGTPRDCVRAAALRAACLTRMLPAAREGPRRNN